MAEKFYPVSIAFAMNDPDTGNITDFCEDIEIGDNLLRLTDGRVRLSIHFRESVDGGFAASRCKGFVRISRRKFPIVGYKYGWGNWCWNLVIVSPETAVEIIDYLKELDCFRCEEGETNFFEKFNADGKFQWTAVEKDLLREEGYQRP